MSVGALAAEERAPAAPAARARAEAAEGERLRPAAQRSAASAGRRWPEPEVPYRAAYQRDRDRIVHSSAFRRLQYKTQVFINNEGDHYRTRLTHTLEVAQIARTASRALGLNEDLTEAVALAHDLGHTPFGHAGEEVLDDLMRDSGGFEHNLQSYRIVTELERAYPDFPGLNLTREARHGVFAHSSNPRAVPEELAGFRSPPLEAQVADLADEIAYSAHDMEDGLASGLLEVDDLRESALFRRHWPREASGSDAAADAADRRIAVRGLLRGVIADLAGALIRETETRLRESGIETGIGKEMGTGPDDDGALLPRRAVLDAEPLVGLPTAEEEERLELKEVLHRRLYRHERVVAAADAGTRLLPGLFRRYLETPEEMPEHFRRRIRGSSPERVVCDYIAGMTDRFVSVEHRRLFPETPAARVPALPRRRRGAGRGREGAR